MGCVKIIGYRNSSFITFWWSLLVLTTTGTLPCLNYTRWHFSKQWQAYKHCLSVSSFTEMLYQPWADHKDSVSPNKLLFSAYWAPAPSKEINYKPGFQQQWWTWFNFVDFFHFDNLSLFRLNNDHLFLHKSHKNLNGKAKGTGVFTIFFKHP